MKVMLTQNPFKCGWCRIRRYTSGFKSRGRKIGNIWLLLLFPSNQIHPFWFSQYLEESGVSAGSDAVLGLYNSTPPDRTSFRRFFFYLAEAWSFW